MPEVNKPEAWFESLCDLQDAAIQEMTRRIKAGDATPSDINNAIKMLKQNGVAVGDPETLNRFKGDVEDALGEVPFGEDDMENVVSFG